jgi:hypothetical protein
MKSPLRTITVLTLSLALLPLAGCVADAPAIDNEKTEESVGASDEMAPREDGEDFPDFPGAPVPDTDAGIAWTALMSSDGEYAAAASYQAVIDAFGPVEPYVSIKEGEERHIDALIRQLERLGVEAPANPYLGVLEAPADLETAARAWAEGEILNVEMYDELLSQTENPNLVRVLGNLRRASLESHLPLFEAAAENGGVLSPEEMARLR